MRQLVPIRFKDQSISPKVLYILLWIDTSIYIFVVCKNAARSYEPLYQTISVRSNTCSGGVEDTLPEQVQLGPSIHLAFEELEPRHLALRLSIAVRKLAGRAHGGILLEARREAFQV